MLRWMTQGLAAAAMRAPAAKPRGPGVPCGEVGLAARRGQQADPRAHHRARRRARHRRSCDPRRFSVQPAGTAIRDPAAVG